MAFPAEVTPAAIHEYVITLSCPDRIGIVHAISGVLVDSGATIIDSQQHGERDSGHFFMRVHAAGPAPADVLRAAFSEVVDRFSMQLNLYDLAQRPRMLVMVSKHGHCLNDLLYRWRSGSLKVEL